MHRRMLVALTLTILTSFVLIEAGSAWARAVVHDPVEHLADQVHGDEVLAGLLPGLGDFRAPDVDARHPVRAARFGGIGLFDLLLIGGGVALLIAFMRRRAARPEPAYAGAGVPTSAYAPTAELPAAVSDLNRGVDHIRQMDGGFDPSSLAATARSTFLAVQDAINRRDLGGIRESLTPEMLTALQTQCDGLRQARRTNRMARIDVRRTEVTEAWQETGQDFVTVHLVGEMLDWVVDDGTGTGSWTTARAPSSMARTRPRSRSRSTGPSCGRLAPAASG